MLKKTLLLTAVLVLTGACSSGGGNPVNILDDVIGDLPTDGNNDMTAPKSLATDVPGVAADTSYYGKYTMTLDEQFVINMTQSSEKKIFDLEFAPSSDTELNIDSFYGFFVGECSDREDSLTWMEVDSSGNVLAEESVNTWSSVFAQSGNRYLLRVSYAGTSGCDQVSAYLTITEAK